MSSYHITVAVPELNNYSQHSGIGRVFNSLREHWENQIRVVNASFMGSKLPILRNFPSSVRPDESADVVLLPRLTGAQALRTERRLPRVVVVHDIGVVDFPDDRKGVDWLAQQSIYRSFSALRSLDAIIVDSEFTRTRLLRFFPEQADRIVTIHPGVDNQFLQCDSPRATARLVIGKYLGCELGSPLLLYVGSELPRKNIALLLRVFQQVKVRYPGAQLLKIGRAGQVRWREQTLRLANVLGFRLGVDLLIKEDLDDQMLIQAYRAADVFISTSLYEGFGLPVLEAMAVGTPVIVTNRGALPEVVGDVGSVVEPEVDHFLMALFAALEYTAHNSSEASRTRAAEFTWDRAAKAYLDILVRFKRNKLNGLET